MDQEAAQIVAQLEVLEKQYLDTEKAYGEADNPDDLSISDLMSNELINEGLDTVSDGDELRAKAAEMRKNADEADRVASEFESKLVELTDTRDRLIESLRELQDVASSLYDKLVSIEGSDDDLPDLNVLSNTY